MYECSKSFSVWSGPRSPRILLLGEAWGQTEDETRQPFSGESGKELFRMLGEALPLVDPTAHARVCSAMQYGNSWIFERGGWLALANIAMTNVFNLRPAGNKLESICGAKKDVGSGYPLPPVSNAKYILSEYLIELSRLEEEIREANPNIIIALGNTASWAVLRTTSISQIRGTAAEGVGPAEGQKVLPTYHPSGVLRNWAWRPIVLADLMKGERESYWPEIRRPERTVHINPTLCELAEWTRQTLANPPRVLSVDIETGAGQIKCIGFARSVSESLVVPFVDLSHPSGSYWPTPGDEMRAWGFCRELLESDIPKLGQNFIYDLQYLTRTGIMPRNCIEDTMLLHHSIYPELQKGLGFLGSIYTNESSWKLLNAHKSAELALKKDE